MRRVVPLALALAAAGCAVTPTIDYHRLSDTPRADSWVPYRLTDTTIVIGAVAERGLDAAGGERPGPPISLTVGSTVCNDSVCAPALAAVAAPIDDETEVLALAPRNRHLVSTYIAPTYWTNSLRLKTLSVEVRDHKIEAINAAGAIVTGVGKLASGAARSPSAPKSELLKLPIVIDLALLRHGAIPVPGHETWRISGKFLDNNIDKAGFVPRAARGGVHGALLTSTCRPMSIALYDGVQKISFRVRVADPEWLTPIPLPSVGEVTLNPLCGGDVTNQKVVEVGVDAMAQAFFAQVDAVRTATK